ncbi:MAG TPA: 3'(2'),5'-bisphosphate nucleotidase CysQ, partial [Phycisphaerales bacterium]|nr:3'(2'),5'-bisphosphate nucleotidase CysQ [Phycisphaerales bacterium]
MSDTQDVLARITAALAAARPVVARYTPGQVAAERKAGGDPVTEADVELDRILRQTLLRPGEGWLSEETADDASRLSARRVWIVDPLDGTREFVEGLDEWCVSVALVEEGRGVAAGIWNPVRDELVLGGLQTGVTLNGESVHTTCRDPLAGAT